MPVQLAIQHCDVQITGNHNFLRHYQLAVLYPFKAVYHIQYILMYAMTGYRVTEHASIGPFSNRSHE
jgi:hypothetical protein